MCTVIGESSAFALFMLVSQLEPHRKLQDADSGDEAGNGLNLRDGGTDDKGLERKETSAGERKQ